MSDFRPENPLIVQSDYSVLCEVSSPRYGEAREQLSRFAELIKSPEHVHTYRISPLSVWNACAAGVAPETIATALEDLAKYPVPPSILFGVRDFASRFGRLRLRRGDDGSDSLVLEADDAALAAEISRHPGVGPLLGERLSPASFQVEAKYRGRVKQGLVKAGFPAEDLAGYSEGEPLPFALRTVSGRGLPFALRDYQREAAELFYAGGSDRGGSGVLVLPCGAGKTVVGMGAMAAAQTSTLILTTSITAVRQWVAELLDKTDLPPEAIGEYHAQVKEVRPVTVATYQILTHRRPGVPGFPHLELFDRRAWGLIVYDEVHLLPAPVFQVTAGLQARRRLGLTATLVREDGHEEDVFALIGPKKVDMPWKVLEGQGWIAEAILAEVRLPLPRELRMPYATAEAREKFRLASENPDKVELVRRILARHPGEPALVIGLYLDQLEAIGAAFGSPVLTGSTPQKRREQLFADFQSGRLPILVVSKVANFAIDLPDASLAIEVSGTFGSRQEEAQRLGRLLRPKPDGRQAHFYTLVSRDTVEQDFALRRQLFLCEQGYEYEILDAHEIAADTAPAGAGGAS